MNDPRERDRDETSKGVELSGETHQFGTEQDIAAPMRSGVYPLDESSRIHQPVRTEQEEHPEQDEHHAEDQFGDDEDPFWPQPLSRRSFMVRGMKFSVV